MIQHSKITSDTLPGEIKAFLGTVHTLTYPRQGDTSDIVVAHCERGSYVVKRSQGEQFSRWLAREYTVLQALREIALPLPRPYLCVETNAPAMPEFWLVMSYLPGTSLRTIAQKEQSKGDQQRMLRSFGNVLAQLHHLSVPRALQSEEHESWLDSMLKQARYNLLHHEVDGDAKLLAQLERERPQPVPQMLIHGDFTVDNVLIVDGEVSGIVDWAQSALGDPRYDLALAIRPKEGIFQTAEDTQSFIEGYGGASVSEAEYNYFTGLYEFF